MITIIDYGVGNLFSVEKAFYSIGSDVCVTNNIEKIASATKLVLPGVGAFGDCMKRLRQTELIPLIKHKIENNTPILGICVGLQILFESSEESPHETGLSVLSGHIKKITAPKVKIPHIGWNSLNLIHPERNSTLLQDVNRNDYVYFVHSYYAVPEDESIIVATTSYEANITAAIAKNNIYATQFHPEKSGNVGLKILRNFMAI